MAHTRKQVSRILAVGNPPEDRVTRLTRGEQFVCCAGDDAEHRALTEFCLELERLLDAGGLQVTDFSPEELRAWIAGFVEEARPA